jgi:hypothetical protein
VVLQGGLALPAALSADLSPINDVSPTLITFTVQYDGLNVPEQVATDDSSQFSLELQAPTQTGGPWQISIFFVAEESNEISFSSFDGDWSGDLVLSAGKSVVNFGAVGTEVVFTVLHEGEELPVGSPLSFLADEADFSVKPAGGVVGADSQFTTTLAVALQRENKALNPWKNFGPKSRNPVKKNFCSDQTPAQGHGGRQRQTPGAF